MTAWNVSLYIAQLSTTPVKSSGSTRNRSSNKLSARVQRGVWTERCRLLVVRRVAAASASCGRPSCCAPSLVGRASLPVCLLGIHCEMGFQTPSRTLHGSLARLIKIMFRVVAQTRRRCVKYLFHYHSSN